MLSELPTNSTRLLSTESSLGHFPLWIAAKTVAARRPWLPFFFFPPLPFFWGRGGGICPPQAQELDESSQIVMERSVSNVLAASIYVYSL